MLLIDLSNLLALYESDMWRSIYWSEQVSLRTRVLLMKDWILRGVFGRDLSRVSFVSFDIYGHLLLEPRTDILF